jgi:hypothetical protein
MLDVNIGALHYTVLIQRRVLNSAPGTRTERMPNFSRPAHEPIHRELRYFVGNGVTAFELFIRH